MAPRLITMLTHNDETVKDALEVFEKCSDLPCDFWGFKDIGLPKPETRRLVRKMKERGKAAFLEIVSLTEAECMEGAVLSTECGFDYLMGTIFYASVFDFLKRKPIKFFPFCGKVTGHPSVIEGTIADVVADGIRLQQLGVQGVDLLAYRFVDDPLELARSFLKNVKIPVVIAGSIGSFERIDVVKKLNPWGFTIGSAFFDSKFVQGGSFRDQLISVLQHLRR